MERVRYRFRKEETGGNCGMINSNGTTTEFSPLSTEYYRRTEAFRDVTGSRGSFHPCSHILTFHSPGTPADFHEEVLYPYDRIEHYFGVFAPDHATADLLLPSNLTGRGTEFLSGLNGASGFTRRALNNVLDQMPETVSIINFVIELEDLKAMCTNVVAQLKNPAGLFLSWNFGWMPLIRDIQQLYATAFIIVDRLKYLRKVNKRTVTVRYAEKFAHEIVPITLSGPVPQPGNDTTHDVTGELEGYTEVFANIQVHYDLEGLDYDLWTALVSTLAALNIGNPAQVVWNAIPFSFVVDWIYNVSDLLDSMEIQPFKGTLTMEGASCAYKTYTRLGHFNMTYKPILGPCQWGAYASTQVFGYHRRSGMPEGDIDMTGLTPFQQALATALLLANGKSWPSRH